MTSTANRPRPGQTGLLSSLRSPIEALGPYQSLVPVLVPTGLIEPFKTDRSCRRWPGPLDYRYGQDRRGLCREPRRALIQNRKAQVADGALVRQAMELVCHRSQQEC